MVSRLAFAFGAALLILTSPALAQHHHAAGDPAVQMQAQARPQPQSQPQRPPAASPTSPGQPAPAPAAAAPNRNATTGMQGGDPHSPRIFTLRSGIAEGRMVYLGVGGDINGKVNPQLIVHEGELVQINLINGEGAEHDVVIDQYGSRSDRVVVKGGSSTFSFAADRVGQFAYYCSVPGHREAGMEGRLLVQPGARAATASNAADVTR